jgi:tetratricopeptide (TPR) repeat protein
MAGMSVDGQLAREGPPEAERDERLGHAEVLTEIGELFQAEAQVARILEERPEDVAALDLLGKIKHIRGELSRAIACWAQVNAKSSHNQPALMRLSSILQLARDAGLAKEFLVLGPFQLWRKPAAHLALEEVFRIFLAGRPDEARERCKSLADKYRGEDADLYRLAVMADAWVAELSGELDAARDVLEKLGEERGFETDADRILALARLYEQIGAQELLEKAAQIYRHFDRGSPKVAILGRLAVLCRKLGQSAEADRYEERFLELFRRRMHRPMLADAARAATGSYVPLYKLTRVRFPRSGKEPEAEGRQLAIELALSGDHDRARERLEESRDLLDLKYRADLAVLDGHRREAVDLYLESLEADPEDLTVLEWLLGDYAVSGAFRVADYFRRPEVAAHALRALQGARSRSPLRPSLWRQVAALHGILGETEEAARCSERAAALEEVALRDRWSVGRVLAAAVYHFVGKPKGLIHEVWAARKPAEPGRGGFLEEILGNLTPDMTQAVRNTFLSVREYARAKWPQQTRDILDYTYAYKVTKEDEPSGGLSAGLPSALAFLSVFLNRSVPQGIASTGALVADAHDVLVIGAVGEPEYKVRGAYNRNLQTAILPEANRAELEASPLVPRAICSEIVRYAASLDDAVVLTFGPDVWIE